jgi:uncharacterized membrane protein YeaQ/YmgE (transglycosylase-associated protein family)
VPALRLMDRRWDHWPLASIVLKTNAQMGLIANVIVGIVGAAVGG